MSRKLPENKIQVIKTLRKEGLSVYKIAKELDITYSTVYTYTALEERRFKSKQKYLKYLIEIKGFQSIHEYRKFLAEQKGYNSVSAYCRSKDKEKQNRVKYKEFGGLIRKRLKELRLNKSQFARGIGISRAMLYLYAQGKSIPGCDLLEKLSSALYIDRKTLDSLLV